MAPSRANIEDFDDLYYFNPRFEYPKDVITELSHSRRVLKGKLFFDRLLDSIHVDGARLYPGDNRKLRQLHRLVVDSDAKDNLKQAAIFYLLKDVKSQPGHDVAAKFAEACYLPNQDWTFTEGIWLLDRLQYKEALECLTSPSLKPAYSEDILAALLDSQEDELALAYYHTISPPLTDPELLLSYFKMLCRGSVTDAFYFSRSQQDSQRRQLFETLIDLALLPRGPQRARNGIELIDLPFNKSEEEWFEDFLLRDGKGRNLANAADTVMMRRIATGKLKDVSGELKELELSRRSHGDITWDNIVDGLEKGMGPRHAEDIYERD